MHGGPNSNSYGDFANVFVKFSILKSSWTSLSYNSYLRIQYFSQISSHNSNRTKFISLAVSPPASFDGLKLKTQQVTIKEGGWNHCEWQRENLIIVIAPWLIKMNTNYILII